MYSSLPLLYGNECEPLRFIFSCNLTYWNSCAALTRNKGSQNNRTAQYHPTAIDNNIDNRTAQYHPTAIDNNIDNRTAQYHPTAIDNNIESQTAFYSFVSIHSFDSHSFSQAQTFILSLFRLCTLSITELPMYALQSYAVNIPTERTKCPRCQQM
jgi:hypothetical protein